MKWIAFAASVGWAAIVALAWRLADHRIGLCYYLETGCIVRATAARDATLISGLKGFLLGTAVLALMAWGAAVLRGRRTDLAPYRSASPGGHQSAMARMTGAWSDRPRFWLSWLLGGAAILAAFALGWFSSVFWNAGGQAPEVAAQVDPARQIAIDAAADATDEAMAAATEGAVLDQPMEAEASPGEGEGGE